MAVLIGDKSNVKFSNINQSQLLTNTKIAVAPYTIDNEGNIINNIPVVNAIDIDWNNVIANDITDPIRTTSDLIHVISTNKVNIRLTNESLVNLKSQVDNIKEKIEGLENIDFQAIQSDLDNALSDIEILQNNNSSINEALINISNIINTINNSMPHYISDLEDGYDVLRRGDFENIKDELKGESAYEIAKKLAQQNHQTFNYTESEWIASLKGEKGNTGSSAYDIAKQTALIMGKEFPYANETEWIESITNCEEAKRYTDEKIAEAAYTAGDGILIENKVIKATANTWINI